MKRIFSLIAFCLVFLAACDKAPKADTIFVGTILTMDPANPMVEAMAIESGQVLTLGSKEAVLQFANRRTDIIELNDQTLMPGFIAAHEHPGISAVFGDLVDLSGLTHPNAESMWQAFETAINEAKPGDWVYGMGIDPVLMPDLGDIDRNLLDQLAPENPVLLISQSLHSFWVNSAAYEAVGIDETVQNPEKGGHYGRDAQGRLNGFIAESKAAAPFIKPLRAPLRLIGALKMELAKLSDQGFTTVGSLGFNAPPWLSKWVGKNKFKPFIRQVVYLKTDELNYLPASPENGNDFYRIAGIKLWHDGSPYSGTMYLEEPYLNNDLTEQMGINSGQTGHALIDNSDLQQQLQGYQDDGWQLAIHSQGDASNRQVIDVVERLTGDTASRRHRLEHGILLPQEKLLQMSNVGLTPSFHINHLWYYGDALNQSILGAPRAQQLLPVASAFDNNLHPTLHADSPMFPASPFSLMATAQMRQSRTGLKLGEDEAISAYQALQAMTVNGAWQMHMDDKIGSFREGMLADMVILSENPLTTEAVNWVDIDVEQVWVQGRQVK